MVEFFGLDRLTNSYGLSMLTRGIAAMFGPPLAGIVYDRAQTYDAAFIFAGLMMLAATVCGCLMPFARIYWNLFFLDGFFPCKRNNRNNNDADLNLSTA